MTTGGEGQAVTLDDLAQVLRGPAKHKPLFMQEFIYFRGGGGRGPQAGRWLPSSRAAAG